MAVDDAFGRKIFIKVLLVTEFCNILLGKSFKIPSSGISILITGFSHKCVASNFARLRCTRLLSDLQRWERVTSLTRTSKLCLPSPMLRKFPPARFTSVSKCSKTSNSMEYLQCNGIWSRAACLVGLRALLFPQTRGLSQNLRKASKNKKTPKAFTYVAVGICGLHCCPRFRFPAISLCIVLRWGEACVQFHARWLPIITGLRPRGFRLLGYSTARTRDRVISSYISQLAALDGRGMDAKRDGKKEKRHEVRLHVRWSPVNLPHDRDMTKAANNK